MCHRESSAFYFLELPQSIRFCDIYSRARDERVTRVCGELVPSIPGDRRAPFHFHREKA